MTDKKKSPPADGNQQSGQIAKNTDGILGSILPQINGARKPEVWNSPTGGYSEWMDDARGDWKERQDSLDQMAVHFFLERALKRLPTMTEEQTMPTPRWLVNGYPRWDATEFRTWLNLLIERDQPESVKPPGEPMPPLRGWY